MKKMLLTLLSLALLSGCAQKFQGGSGQLFQLSERHVIYRDLTVPESLGNEPVRQNVSAPDIAP
ncbi:lipoprotein [Klebsiella pneumoniae]|uniref:lipoprotein n=1 Tax=Klebsiella pneumoniae TaxID=573 RepID=UPI0018A3A01C|nr:lipoprotein [Klebsiella pneumoniae]ELE4368165.1 lipoprotein [Salmonella enterica]EIX9714759.1 lipoprotein [Klebsiella pneumoniae]EMD7130174.1 lipoprotein [Salmonella enterica]MDE8392901.1 lipoprotein [Klebsiella pneumoniae]BBW89496.1 hypothetical protein THOKLE017_P30330 [Klebsiella pneumoniae]